MAVIEHGVAKYSQCLAGTENDLNHILSTFVESEHKIENFCNSRYIELSDFTSIIKDNGKDFAILTLNIQSIYAKFNNLYPLINNLSLMGLYFGAICLPETWLSSDADVSLLHIPGYKLSHQGSRCTRNGGLVIYLHEQYTYKLRNMYTRSDISEGLFIDVSGHNLHRPITIGNIYRPPHNNNDNANIETFIEEMSPMINTLQKENRYATIVGDFNTYINLLEINEREKFDEFFDLMCTNHFFPKLTLPTRSSKRSCVLSLIKCSASYRI